MKQLSTRRSRRHRNPHTQDQQQEQQPFFTKQQPKADTQNAFFQAKLTIGQPGDKYEQEADRMADAVVNGSNNTAAVQKKAEGIQKMDHSEMEKDKMVQEKPMIQRMEGGEEEEPVQMQSAEEEEPIQKMEGEEEEAVQMQTEEEEPVQMMEGEEEESVQMQKEEEGAVQTKSNTAKNTASPKLSQRIKARSGSGKAMSKPVQSEMEQAFGTDFSGVNIHTDSTAIQMNKELGAQAFTHGKDVYFNSGKYYPESSQGKHLLAHELTHVVQQGGVISDNQLVQRKFVVAGENHNEMARKSEGEEVTLRDKEREWVENADEYGNYWVENEFELRPEWSRANELFKKYETYKGDPAPLRIKEAIDDYWRFRQGLESAFEAINKEKISKYDIKHFIKIKTNLKAVLSEVLIELGHWFRNEISPSLDKDNVSQRMKNVGEKVKNIFEISDKWLQNFDIDVGQDIVEIAVVMGAFEAYEERLKALHKELVDKWFREKGNEQRERSHVMHHAAQIAASEGQDGVWKIGDIHVDEIKVDRSDRKYLLYSEKNWKGKWGK